MTVAQALGSVTALGIDTAPIIYFIENNPVYIARMQEVLLIIASQNLPTFTSVVTLTEVLTQPLRVGDATRAMAFRNYLLNPGIALTLTAVDVAIAERAAELRAKYKLKTPDAIQLATAIESGCDAFLHNDTQLLQVAEVNSLLLQNLTP